MSLNRKFLRLNARFTSGSFPAVGWHRAVTTPIVPFLQLAACLTVGSKKKWTSMGLVAEDELDSERSTECQRRTS